MDTLGIEPRASRMLSGRDATTQRAIKGVRLPLWVFAIACNTQPMTHTTPTATTCVTVHGHVATQSCVRVWLRTRHFTINVPLWHHPSNTSH